MVPIVLFYNKRDLPDIMPVEYMDATFGLRTWKVPRLSGSALTGQNVLKAADLITSNLIRQLAGRLGLEEKEDWSDARIWPPPLVSLRMAAGST